MFISSKLFSKFLLPIIVAFYVTIPMRTAAEDPSVHGHMISDLVSTQPADFEQEIAYWIASGLVDSTKKYTTCDLVVLGGADILQQGGYFERTYTDLPSHDILYFTIRFTTIDLWNTGDTFSLSFDGVAVIPGWSPGLSSATFSNNYCGTSLSDLALMNAVGKALHTGSTLTLRVTFNLKRSGLTGGLGFRNIDILLATKSPGEVASCCAASTATTLANTVQCICSPSYYQDAITGCTQCNPRCRECFGVLTNQCYSYKPGYGYDGSQIITCSFGCRKCTGPNANQCDLCDSSHWLYDDKICRSSCAAPYVSKGVDARTCINLCQSQGMFELWDGTCISTCNYPLSQRTQIKTKYCDFPCASGRILMWDASCTATCDYPNKLRVIAGEKLCEHPCGDPTYYYYEKDQTCRPQCLYPYTVVIKASNKVCVFDISQDDADQASIYMDIFSITNPIICALAAFISFLNSKDVIVLFAVGFSELLQYLTYLRVQYPPTLYYMLNHQVFASIGFTFIPDLPLETKISITKHSIDEKFEDRGLHSSFIINAWRYLLVLASVITMLVVTIFLKALFCDFPRARYLLQKVINTIKWNFLLIVLCCDAGLLALYTCLEFSTVDFDSTAAGFGFFICLGLNITLFVTLGILAKISKDFKTVKNTSRRGTIMERVKITEKKWKNFRIFFHGFEKNAFTQQMHPAIFILRAYFQFILVVALNDSPLALMGIFTSISFLMLIYLRIHRPLGDRLTMIYVSVQEVALFAINICVTILAVFDKREEAQLDHRYRIEAAIIWISLVLTAISLGFLAIKLLLILKAWLWKGQKRTVKLDSLKPKQISATARPAVALFTEGRIRARRDPNYYL